MNEQKQLIKKIKNLHNVKDCYLSYNSKLDTRDILVILKNDQPIFISAGYNFDEIKKLLNGADINGR
jgi:hypothetical protein